MATKLTKPVSREIVTKDINGTEGDVIVTIDAKGVSLRAKGKKRTLTVPWDVIAKAAPLPLDAPAKFTGNHMGYLVCK